MTQFFAIIRKDILVRFSSRAELLFFLILPLIFTFMVGGGLGNAPGGDNRLRLLVVDQAPEQMSFDLLYALSTSPALRTEVLPLAEAEAQFADREAAAVLILPAEMGSAGEVELRLQPNSLNAQAIERAVLAVVGAMNRPAAVADAVTAEAERRQPFATEAERAAFRAAAADQARELYTAAPERLTVTRPERAERVAYDPAAQGSAGQLITWVFIPLIGISGLLPYERAQGTLRRLVITPATRATLVLGTLSGQVLMALAQMAVLVVFGALALGLPWGREPVALAVVLTASALAAGALGVLLGTFVKTEGQASGLSIMLGMVMALLGGCWYPIELFPEAVRTAVQVLPTTWAMQGLMDLLVRGEGLAGIALEAGVLMGFAALFFGVGAARFRFE